MSHPIVLCYHAVSESWPAPLSVTPRRPRAPAAPAERPRVPRRDVHPGDPRTGGSEDDGGDVRRRLSLGVRGRLSDPLTARASRHRLRPERLRGQRGADGLAGNRPVARGSARGRAPADVLGSSSAAWRRLAGRSAPTAAPTRCSPSSTMSPWRMSLPALGGNAKRASAGPARRWPTRTATMMSGSSVPLVRLAMRRRAACTRRIRPIPFAGPGSASTTQTMEPAFVSRSRP